MGFLTGRRRFDRAAALLTAEHPGVTPDGALAIAVPGHTPGSVAIHLPRHRVLFTGDAVASRPDGTVIRGVFNVNRAQAADSLRRLATLDVSMACFGHGDPVTHDAATALRSAAQGFTPPGATPCG